MLKKNIYIIHQPRRTSFVRQYDAFTTRQARGFARDSYCSADIVVVATVRFIRLETENDPIRPRARCQQNAILYYTYVLLAEWKLYDKYFARISACG